MRMKLLVLMLLVMRIALSSSSPTPAEPTIEESSGESSGESVAEATIESTLPLSATSSNQSSPPPPQNTLPELFYNRFSLLSRRGWTGFLHRLGFSWWDSITNAENGNTIYEADRKYFSKTEDPNVFDVVIGEWDRNHTFISNITFGQPLDVVTPFGQYRVVYFYIHPYLYEQFMDTDDKPINPIIQSWLVRDDKSQYALCVKYLYRSYSEEPYRKMIFSRWRYVTRRERTLSEYISRHSPRKTSEEDKLCAKTP